MIDNDRSSEIVPLIYHATNYSFPFCLFKTTLTAWRSLCELAPGLSLLWDSIAKDYLLRSLFGGYGPGFGMIRVYV